MRRYGYYFRAVKTIFYDRAQRERVCSEVGTSEQRTYISLGKIHAFFTRYIFFHMFTSENMENTSALVYGKTPITI